MFLWSSPDMVVTTGTPLRSCEDENQSCFKSRAGVPRLMSFNVTEPDSLRSGEVGYVSYPSAEASAADFEGGSLFVAE